MIEANLRAWHRQVGIMLVIFIIVQTATGIVISVGQFTSSPNHEHKEQAVSNRAPSPMQKDTRDHAKAAAPPRTTNYANPGGESLDIVMAIHHGGGGIGAVYRMLLGAGLMIQASMGILIFFKIGSVQNSVSKFIAFRLAPTLAEAGARSENGPFK